MSIPKLGLLRGALDLVFASTCVACGGIIPSDAEERSICLACWTRARPIPRPRCPRCWTPLPPSVTDVVPTCRECPNLRPALRAIRSAFVLGGPVRAMVHNLKYRGWYSLARPMALRMRSLEWPAEVEEEVRLVVSVPLAPVRRRQRGYNQAALLAREIAHDRGWKDRDDILERTRSASSQTTLHPGERRANVAGAFRVASGAGSSIAAQHLLLVDDVWTTGATTRACADALLEAGARAVSIATFARALPELERHQRRLESAAIPLTQVDRRR